MRKKVMALCCALVLALGLTACDTNSTTVINGLGGANGSISTSTPTSKDESVSEPIQDEDISKPTQDDGTTDKGTAEGGVTNEGTTEDGTTNEGTTGEEENERNLYSERLTLIYSQYRELLREIDYLLRGGENANVPASTGLKEIACSVDEPQKAVGYDIADINMDDTPELILIEIDMSANEGTVKLGGNILAMYTWNGEEVVPVIEGWARNTYYCISAGVFVNFGSDGASESSVTYYTMDSGSYELTQLSCYYSEYDEASDTVKYYVLAENETKETTAEEFAAANDYYESVTAYFVVTPMSSFDYNCFVKAQYVVDYNMSVYEEDKISDTSAEDECMVVFTIEAPLKEFTLYDVTVDTDRDGNLVYNKTIKEEFGDGYVGYISTAVLKFGGDMSAYAISYKDEFDVPYSFILTMSGEDGSLIFTEE